MPRKTSNKLGKKIKKKKKRNYGDLQRVLAAICHSLFLAPLRMTISFFIIFFNICKYTFIQDKNKKQK